jgi:hypothetical protein
MEFTNEQRNEYLDKLALSTQQGMWVTEMAQMKAEEKLGKKKALLTVIEQKIENKEYKSTRDGKNEKHQVESDINDLEAEIQESKLLLETGRVDLEMIEQYRGKSV